ncbi:MAG: hypothetical protein ACU0FO_09340 [Pseudooceanicola nanhaiensis]|uniref:hypothetical protein n=1 Tax=Pseudooceanicola nanhaiensis TaxID=375761 RepID=UPI0040597A33
MSFDITFDYRFDSTGFFTDPARRAALEEAGRIWEGIILDEFADVAAGTTFTIDDPSQGGTTRTVTLDAAIDDLLIFVGAEDLPGPLGLGGYDGTDARGDIFSARVTSDFRGQGPATDFEPWVGTVTFDTSASWGFSLAGPEAGRSDFLTVALHEIGHVLGVGTAPAFDALIAGTLFTGVNAQAANGGAPLPLDPGLGHVVNDYAGDSVLMDPSTVRGTRTLPGDIDRAILADIGYEIAGTVHQGTRFPLTTEGADVTVFGTLLDDLIDGRGGDDRLQGDAGNDTLEGGTGQDTLSGQDGDDRLDGGAGDDQVQGGDGADRLIAGAGEDTLFGQAGTDSFEIRAGGGRAVIADFDLGSEVIVLEGSGFASAADAVAAVTRPFGNVSRLTFGDGTSVDVFHASSSASPLEARHFQIIPPEEGRTLTGTSGPDRLEGGALADTISGLDGADTLIGNGGDDFIFGGATAADLRDVVYGGDGNDAIDGGFGNDELRGDAGDDTITGGAGVDTIIGGAGADELSGQTWSDVILGGDGADFINGGFGHDRVNGGAGADRFYHLGVEGHGSDWIQDFSHDEGDLLLYGGSATRNAFQVNFTETANAGEAGVQEAFVIYRPTGQILWALVDGAAQENLALQLGGETVLLL